MTLDHIETLTKGYADQRAILADRVQALQDELETAKRRRLLGIKQALAKAAEVEATLKQALEESSALFAKPKTQVFHGIQVGYRKGKGKIEWEDDEALVAKIKKVYGDDADVLLITKVKPSKTALNDLDAADLRKLGVTVEDAGDVVVIKPVDGDVDKLVKALLKDAVEQMTEDAA